AVSRLLGWWLIDNCPSPERCSPVTREQLFDLSRLPDEFGPVAARIEAGALVVDWSHGEGSSRFDPGWLSAHDYGAGYDGEDRPEPRLWRAADMPEPPTVEGARILEDDQALEDWLSAVAVYGFGRLRDAPRAPGDVERICARIGTIRETNFGRVFDVRARLDADSAAYLPVPLEGHVDLPTREYQPGLQALHCLENTTAGGLATMADGFAIAEALRAADPSAFETLTERPMVFANRAKSTDYRWRAPAIGLDRAGRYVEVRVGPFLRGPQAERPERMAELYRAIRAITRLARDPAFQTQYAYAPGDLVLFDNRRLLHGRTAYDGAQGARWLQGVYLERDELYSRLRMLRRAKRAAMVGG
ncbi:MAG: TauD/TfdA family dioxygenase, partial [Pseudomonadota bacterium]